MQEKELESNIEDVLKNMLLPCAKCHVCNTVCPIYEGRITQSPFGISRSIYYAIKWNEYNQQLRDLVYSCTTCGKCVEKCKNISRSLPLTEIFEKTREFLLIEKMLGPMPDQINVLKNMYVRGNPWGNPSYERTKWAQELNIPLISENSDIDILYFVGCATAYDLDAQKIAKNLAKIFKRASVNFGILEKEVCSGSEARRLGEKGLFEYLSATNIEMFEKSGAKVIVTGDPHSFYTFTKEYNFKNRDLRILHYTEFINELIDDRKLELTTKVGKRVTYHDPCYLGRHSEVYEEPRKLIRAIPGITFVEIENSKENSDCCGMGGGRMWTEAPTFQVSSQTITRKRLEQAISTSAEVLLTACPFCNIAFYDSIKSFIESAKIEVMDITELICKAL